MTYLVQKLDHSSACEIAARILPTDWEECIAMTGEHPGDLLKKMARTALPSFGVYRESDDEPLLVFGAIPRDDKEFGVWLLATDALRLRDSVVLRKRMDDVLRELGENVGCSTGVARCSAWTGNTVHMRWLRSSGWFPTGRLEQFKDPLPFKELMYVCT